MVELDRIGGHRRELPALRQGDAQVQVMPIHHRVPELGRHGLRPPAPGRDPLDRPDGDDPPEVVQKPIGEGLLRLEPELPLKLPAEERRSERVAPGPAAQRR